MIRNIAVVGAVALGAVGVGVGWTVQQNVFADDEVGGTVGSAGVDLDGDGVISEDERLTPSALYFDCPGGLALGELHDGDRILTVGKHDTVDGWLALRQPLAPDETVWIAAEQVVSDGETAELPAMACTEGQAFQVAAVAAPDESTTTAPTSETTSTTSTTTTTAPKVTTTTRRQGTTTTTTSTTTSTTAPPPSISNVVRSPTQIIEQYDGGSCGGVNVSDIEATGANATSMTMSWAAGPQSGSVTMAKSGSTFTAAFGPFPKETIASATASIVITLDATGPGGTATRQTSVTLKNCSIG